MDIVYLVRPVLGEAHVEEGLQRTQLLRRYLHHTFNLKSNDRIITRQQAVLRIRLILIRIRILGSTSWIYYFINIKDIKNLSYGVFSNTYSTK